MAKDTLSPLRRKLEKMELEHLRIYAAELEERLEQAQAEADRAYASADFWQRNFDMMQEAAMDDEFSTHRCVGINKSGELMVVAK